MKNISKCFVISLITINILMITTGLMIATGVAAAIAPHFFGFFDGFTMSDIFPLAFSFRSYAAAAVMTAVMLVLWILLIVGLSSDKCKSLIPISLYALSAYAIINAIIVSVGAYQVAGSFFTALIGISYLFFAIYSSVKSERVRSVLSKLAFLPIIAFSLAMLYSLATVIVVMSGQGMPGEPISASVIVNSVILIANILVSFAANIGILFVIRGEKTKTKINATAAADAAN